MKIIQLTAENVKKLKVVNITPTKDFIQITGKNGSGKTSVLDSIWWALAGKDSMKGQDQPIRKGEEKATIKLNLGELIITRRFTAAGTTLTVETAEGFKAPSPQAMLDALIGHFAFDPLEFSRMESKEQFKQLRHISDVKLDFDALAALDKADREARQDVNREAKQLQAQIDAIKVPADAPDQPVKIIDLMNQMEEIEHFNGKNIEATQNLNDVKRKIIACKEHIERLKEENIRRQSELSLLIDEEAKLFVAIEPLKDNAEIKAKIAGAQQINDAFAAKKSHADLVERKRILDFKSENHTEAMTARESERQKALQESKMPIPGLSLGDGEVLYNALPFSQLSAAEKLRISVAIAMAANPKLKIIRIQDGSLLDDNSLKMIQEMAKDQEYQVWCERVDSTGKVGIFMEDGEVSSINES